MESNIGNTVTVLFDNLRPNGEVSGYTDNFCQVFVKGSDELLGKFVDVKVTSATRTALKGEVVK